MCAGAALALTPTRRPALASSRKPGNHSGVVRQCRQCERREGEIALLAEELAGLRERLRVVGAERDEVAARLASSEAARAKLEKERDRLTARLKHQLRHRFGRHSERSDHPGEDAEGRPVDRTGAPSGGAKRQRGEPLASQSANYARAAALAQVGGFPALGVLRRLRPTPVASADDEPARRETGRVHGRAEPGRFPCSSCAYRRGSAQLFPGSLATSTPQHFLVACTADMQ